MQTPGPNSNAKGGRPKVIRSPVLTVKITKELFESAKQRDSSHCMIAEAIKLAYPDATGISVDLQTCRFSDPNKRLRYVYLTPRIGQIGLIRFDQGEQIEPFQFRLARAHILNMGEQKKPETTDVDGIKIDQTTASPVPTKIAIRQQQARNALQKARLAQQGLQSSPTEDRKGHVPQRLGGKAPPVSVGKRRSFGLRAIQS